MPDTSKSTESRSKSRSGGGWNPFRRMMSIVTGRAASDADSSSVSTNDKVIIRWTAACLNTTCPIFSKNPQFNMIYSPAPSLLMFVVVTLSSENAMTKTLHRLFEISDEDIADIREMCTKLNALRSPNAFYCFIRFLVDEEPTTTVSKELMAKSNDVACQQVFASIRPSRALKYLNSLAFSPVTVSRPALLTTNGYASAGLNAKWIGKTRKAGFHRFACSYYKRKWERFFEIRTSYKRVLTDEFEVIEVPFQNHKANYGSFLWLRPHFLGHLPYANRHLNTDNIAKMLDDLSSATWLTGRLLLPQFSATGAHDLWKNLMRHGVQPDLGQSQKSPPMASLWHWINMSVSSEGVSGVAPKSSSRKSRRKKTASQRTMEQKCRARVSGDSLYEKHRTYSARIDSPFTYMVMINGIPLFTGSYFGSPPPRSSELFVNAPERIRHRRHSGDRQKRRRGKETRKQKLLRKLKRSEDREREKDRRRAEHERKKQKKTKKKVTTSSESVSASTSATTTTNTTTTTTTASKSASTSALETPQEARPEEPYPKPEPEKKSKSSKWRRFRNIFKKKTKRSD